MKKRLLEIGVIAVYLIKWLTLSVAAGLFVGALSAGFLWLLNFACDFTAKWEYYFVLLPAAMFFSSLIIKHLAPDAEGHGTEKAIAAIHQKSGRVPLIVVPIKLFTTILTIAAGGSVGKEGPTTQIGAGAASAMASALRLSDRNRKTLVICGMSAAFAAIFGTPIAAALFALEVLVVGSLQLSRVFPAFLSAVSGWFISNIVLAPYLGTAAERFPLAIPSVTISGMALAAAAGLFFGLVALALILSQKGAEWLSGKIKIYKPLKGLIGGAALVGLAFLCGRQYLGMGLTCFSQVAAGTPAHLYDFLLKIVFTVITLAFGGSGGILTPILFIGVTAGSAFGGVFGLDSALFACLGMLAVLASATNTPLACTVMALELFSPSFAVYAMIACPIAYLITGHRSVYPTQLLAASKSDGLFFKRGSDIEHATLRARLALRLGGKKLFMQKITPVMPPSQIQSREALPGAQPFTAPIQPTKSHSEQIAPDTKTRALNNETHKP